MRTGHYTTRPLTNIRWRSRSPNASSTLRRRRSSPLSGGFVGMITTNTFMKRPFGKKMVEEFLPAVDLTHVIDTSGAYIPGHGTPTVILFGRNQRPASTTVRAVLGIRGEPGRPAIPANGRVWNSIETLLDHSGEENEFVSVEDVPRSQYTKHPWSLQGGAAPTREGGIGRSRR